LYAQEDYVRRFGPESFTQTDGMSWAEIKSLKERHRADFMIGGPPCKFYSRARVRGEATQPPLIDGFRDMCGALFGEKGKWAIENVMGAAAHMSAEAVVLDGSYFGLRVARARLYESNFELHIDQSVRLSADALAARCCLGGRRRFRRFDEFGRPAATCCQGNIFAVQGTAPWKCTVAECSAAMGVDIGHMSFERLAQSVPPQYGQLVFSQMCMRHAHEVYGAPAITFDEMRAHPAWAQRTMAFWLRGAGAPASNAGLLFQPAPALAQEPLGTSRAERHADEGCEMEAEFRELFYSHAGGYDQQWVRPGVGGRLGRVAVGVTLTCEPTVSQLLGRNTFIEVGGEHASHVANTVLQAVGVGGSGTRATMVVPQHLRRGLFDRGFDYLACNVGGKGPDALAYKQLVAMHVGRRAGVSAPRRLVHADVRGEMDVRDRGDYEPDPVEKSRFTWQDFPHDPERFRGKGLPMWVERMMVVGAVVDESAPVIAKDHQQYSWPDGVALVEAILETDRHLAIGALEYVPDHEVADVLKNHVVHPILLVAQGKGKFRACHDYSRGTNHTATTAPFSLPSVWEARATVKPSSYFCKYDLRDGFFSIPIHPESRNRLVVRHPATGRLCRCARLPFGYIDSPRLFCGLTEAIADMVRRRTVGKGVHVYVFVDDFLIVGDSREAARLGGETLEEVLHEMGIPWAPHKQRGPARCMEFLGLLLCNVPGHRCVALTAKRQEKLMAQLDLWMGRKPSRVGIGAVTADVRELASFLGHLVFCSQVVPQGRTYMQGMLSQFAGLEVDWRRGEVRPTGGSEGWRKGVEIRAGFWRDLEWWRERLAHRNSTPMEVPARGEVAVCGTDASDWGTGQLVWESGQRAEVALRFTLAERARSINWRELLGILRVVELYGVELRGRSLLIEGDNTASLAAAEKESSRAEDSQELVRRLVEAIERFDLTVRFTHTPGVKLDRPDQTSRGDPIEEPRARLTRGAFALLEGRFGPFSEFLGAERQLASAPREEGPPRIWMHPSHATVGSALRRLGERMGDRGGAKARGVVVVPHDEGAKWWPLVRHFSIVGRLPRGGAHLEMCRVGGWVSTPSARASLILAFPRCVGSVRPVTWGKNLPQEGYVYSDESKGWHLPLAAGAFVYYSSAEAGKCGVLMQVWAAFNPASAGEIEFDDDEPIVRAVELLQVKGVPAVGGRGSFELDAPGSFANNAYGPWKMDARLLFDVTHIVEITIGMSEGRSSAERLYWKDAKAQRLVFDWRRAEAQMMLRQPQGDAAAAAAELAASGGGASARDDLEHARASAREAASARKAVPRSKGSAKEGESVQAPPARSPAEVSTVQRCRSAIMLCAGCGGKIGWGKPMVAGGNSFVHPLEGCKQAADERLKTASAVVTSGSAGSEKRGVQLAHRVSSERVTILLCCLEGRCLHAGEEPKIWCTRGCGRGLHGRSCGSFGAGVVQLGNLVCAHCRAQDLVEVSCTPTERMVRRTAEAMVVEMATGSSNTHKGYSDLAMLERKWQADMAGAELRASQVRLPHTSEEGTYSFVVWLALDGGRARSLGTTVRQLGSLCAKLELPDYSKSKRVKGLLKELEAKGEADTCPDTQVTTLMIAETYGPDGTLAACGKVQATAPLITARETVLNDFELVGGMRVGEVCGGGEGHGMLANNVCIQRIEEGPGSEYGQTIEARIEDSKTGLGRYTVFVGETQTSKVLTAAHLREWWRLCSTEVVKRRSGPFMEERPDYWVVRVSLLDMSDAVYRAFMRAVEWSTELVIIHHRAASLKYAKERRVSVTLGEEMRYVNVAGGARGGREVRAAREWLFGMGMEPYTDVVPGPLVRAMLGHTLTHMPYSPKSTSSHLVPAMDAAFARVKASGVADPEYDTVSDPTPKFGNHSNRRHADRVAMRNAEANGVKNEDIDFFFGWNLKKMREDMRMWYAGLDRVLRLRLSKVTMMI